jgi:phosphohistidine phosphatase
MKKLFILRHGKAEDYNEGGDKLRELTHRGVKDSERMGNLLGAQIDASTSSVLFISSDAQRAAQTAHLAALAAGYASEIAWNPEIYEASVLTLLNIVQTVPNDYDSIILVGHNPGLEEFLYELTGEAYDNCSLPTCGLAEVHIADTWSKADSGDCKLEHLWSPKDL